MNTSQKRGMAGAGAAMSLVGTLTAVSATISGYPVFGGQAARYAAAALVLLVVARLAGGPARRPSARDWLLLTALAATGLVAFNVCIVLATRDTSPATVGTVIATVPIVLAVVGPLLDGRRPAPAIIAAACVVAAGAALANGLGSGSGRGLLLSLGALAGEVGFSLLAVPLLPRLGPLRVSAYSAALAVPMLLAAGLVADGTALLRVPTPGELAGFAYLSIVVTTIAFLLWYDAIGRLGADRAGLCAGLIPVSAVVTTVALGIGRPEPADLAGAALVAAGVVVGLRARVAPRGSAPAEPVTCEAAPIGIARGSA
ncbi:drug/metabolite transporter (DMT)-like permease [Actinomadura luteofluorescens]|uniref:Drug/metabolite transporter (DMT)-like permease n=2 Tax=Actinomadura luteofluorescens TaxID=46163 RepID=A0A7Y9EFN3_9ACTN|nr:EamA family transporter [Actinomadura luteofluorescens]NYD46742.1 drug/metabolite transporter (DMT)-like permease [Actinomadura luteofluorescens]